MAISDWFKNLFKASSFQGTVYSDPVEEEGPPKEVWDGASFQMSTSLADAVVAASEPATGIESWSRLREMGTVHNDVEEDSDALFYKGTIEGKARAYMLTGHTYFSLNFFNREVACRDASRTMPAGDELSNAIMASEMMEAIRSYLGDRAITVNSWYRTPEYNRQVGGAKNSYHVKGMAVDFTVAGLTPAQVQRKLIQARDSGKLDIGGIGKYKTFTHCDIGPKRTWQG